MGRLGCPRSPLRSWGSPGHAPGTPVTPWDPRARPWNPRDAPGTPGHAHETPGHAPRTPGDVPETPWGRPWDPRGRPWDHLGPPGTPMGLLMDHKNCHISTNRQRQKLSIAVFEAAHQGPSHERLDRAVFSMKRPPKSKRSPPVPGSPFRACPNAPGPGTPVIYRLAGTCQLN